MPSRTRALSPQANRYSGAGLGRFHMPSARNSDPEEQVRAGRRRREVLDEVDEDEGAARAVKEGDLAHEACPLQRDL